MIKKIIKLIVILAISFTAFSCTAQAIKNKDVNTAQAVDVVEPYAFNYSLNQELTIQIADGTNKSIYDYLVSISVTSTRVTVRAVGVKSNGTTLVRNTLFNDDSFAGLYSSVEAVYWDTVDTIPQSDTFEAPGGNMRLFSGRIAVAGAPDSELLKVADVGTVVCTTQTINTEKYLLIKLYRNEGESEDETNVPMWVMGIEIPTATQQFYIWKNRLTYDEGLADGIGQGYNDGLADGLEQGYQEGYAEGLGDGYDEGFNDGSLNLNTAQAFWVGAQNFLASIGNMIASLFEQEIIPTSGIAIGHIVIGLPLLFGALALIFKFFGRKEE